MKGRFGKDIYCQVCGKDDKITLKGIWTLGGTSFKISSSVYNFFHLLIIFSRSHGARWKFGYKYRCSRCRVKVKEVDQSKEELQNKRNVTAESMKK